MGGFYGRTVSSENSKGRPHGRTLREDSMGGFYGRTLMENPKGGL